MRSLNSIKNTIISLIMNFLNVLAVFISQRFFINILGEEYLGINSLFTDIISFLSIAELGFGSAIIYSMYEPIATNDEDKLKSLMKFYQKVYQIIALLVFAIGLCIVPFLTIIVGETSIETNIYLIYSLFLLETVSSYFISYKRSILYANQQAYLLNLIHILYIILANVSQIFALIYTKNYVFYLILKIIFKTLENVLITCIANKLYPYINEKDVADLPKENQKEITKKVRGLFLHKVGSASINATDNIIISFFFGVGNVGLYTNYTTIITGITVFITHIFYALTATVGNLLLENNKEKSYRIYKSVYLFDFWVYTFASIGFVCLGEQFISIWVGKQYLLDFALLITLGIRFFFTGMQNVFNLFKDAAGIFYEDRFIPLIQGLINIVASIILLYFFGITGVVLGTIISTLILFMYSFPKFIYKPLFDKDIRTFFKEQLSHLLLYLLVYFTCIIIVQTMTFESFWLSVGFRLSVALIVPNLIYLLIFFKTDEFKYYLSLLKVFKESLLKKKN